jgi:hypothetical protein
MLLVVQLAKKSPDFCGNRKLSVILQEPATGHCSEPEESNAYSVSLSCISILSSHLNVNTDRQPPGTTRIRSYKLQGSNVNTLAHPHNIKPTTSSLPTNVNVNTDRQPPRTTRIRDYKLQQKVQVILIATRDILIS